MQSLQMYHIFTIILWGATALNAWYIYHNFLDKNYTRKTTLIYKKTYGRSYKQECVYYFVWLNKNVFIILSDLDRAFVITQLLLYLFGFFRWNIKLDTGRYLTSFPWLCVSTKLVFCKWVATFQLESVDTTLEDVQP